MTGKRLAAAVVAVVALGSTEPASAQAVVVEGARYESTVLLGGERLVLNGASCSTSTPAACMYPSEPAVPRNW